MAARRELTVAYLPSDVSLLFSIPLTQRSLLGKASSFQEPQPEFFFLGTVLLGLTLLQNCEIKNKGRL